MRVLGAQGRSGRVRLLYGVGPFVAWMVGLAVCHRLRSSNTYWTAALWGVLLLFSFVSWGRLVTRTLSDRRPLGWGLHACLGMALALAFFGVLACVRLAAGPAILIWSAAGPLLHGLDRARRGETTHRRSLASRVRALMRGAYSPIAVIGLGLLTVVAVMQYAHAVMNTDFNAWDDQMAYRSFIREFLDTGTLTEGFSFRRVGAYGGQSFLQAMVLVMTDRDRVHLLDNGICLLVAFGLVTGYRGGTRLATRAAVLVAALILLTLPYYLHNLGGQYSGLVFFLALFRIFDDPEFEEMPTRTNAVLIGLLGAAICTLRQNYLGTAFLLVGLVYLALVLFPGAKRRSAWFKQGAAAVGMIVLCLLPWIVLSTIAIHTPLYPLLRGNVRPDFGFLGSVSWDEEIRWGLQNVFTFSPLSSIALFFVAAAVLRPIRSHRAIQTFMLATLLGFVLMMHFFRAFNDTDSIARYYFSFTIAFSLAVILRVLAAKTDQAPARTSAAAIGLVAFAVGHQLLDNKEWVLKNAYRDVSSLHDLIKARGPFQRGDGDFLYDRIQAAVPRGAPMLVMLDHPYLLDGKRNPIFIYDHPGTMGPKGGPPTFQGPEALARYFKRVGIRYLAYQIGTSSREFNPSYWEEKKTSTTLANGRGSLYKIQAYFELDSFASFKALAASRHTLFSEGEIRVLDLETGA